MLCKFMMHWMIAFIWLYGEYNNGSERQNNKSFCWKEDNQRKLKLYDPFETLILPLKIGQACAIKAMAAPVPLGHRFNAA